MRRLMLLLVVVAAAAACQRGAATLTDEDIAAIRNLGRAYAEASLAGDADGLAAVYAEDATEMPPNAPATIGRAAIRNRYTSGLELSVESIEFTVTSVEIDGMNGLAYDRGTYRWTGSPPGTTEPVTEAGKYLAIAHQQEDGSWLWTAVIWNSDTPPPQPE